MTCCLWSFDDGELTQIISHAAMDDGHKKSIRCLCFGPPDSHWLATGSFDGSVKVWDLETFELKQTLLEHKRGVHSCASCLDSRMVVSGRLRQEHPGVGPGHRGVLPEHPVRESRVLGGIVG
jgi:WD40 repeat protein